MATLKLVSFTPVQLFQSSDLNSLASGSYKYGSGSGVTSNVFDNTANLYPEADIQILLGSFNPSGLPFISFHFLWSADGTDFPDPQTAGAPIPPAPIFTAGVNPGSSAKIITIPRVPLRPLKGKAVIGNLTGTTFAASLNSCSLAPAAYTIV